ncbi:MAG: hypothetical protein WC867_02445 [Candidatus Pacearchaeota archaeon]|jgi:hypothetical protein
MVKNNNKFPIFAAVLLVLGIVWFFNELNILPWSNIPWFPLILIVIAIGMIINRYSE